MPPVLHSLQPVRVKKSQSQTPECDPFTHLVELIEHRHRRCPVNARIRDTHAVLEPLGPLARDILAPSVDVRLDHHAHNRGIASLELFTNVVKYFGLVIVVLSGVAVCLVDNDD